MYLTALEKQPRANEPLSGLVRLYLSEGKETKAIALLKDTIKKDPEYLAPYNLLGEVGIATKDYKLAVNSFNSAIDINDKWWIPYRGLSLAHAAQGDVEKSMLALKGGFDKGVNVERLGIDLAILQYKLDKRANSIETYEKIIDKVPNSKLAINNLAMVLVDESATPSDIEQAVSYINELEGIGN